MPCRHLKTQPSLSTSYASSCDDTSFHLSGLACSHCDSAMPSSVTSAYFLFVYWRCVTYDCATTITSENNDCYRCVRRCLCYLLRLYLYVLLIIMALNWLLLTVLSSASYATYCAIG